SSRDHVVALPPADRLRLSPLARAAPRARCVVRPACADRAGRARLSAGAGRPDPRSTGAGAVGLTASATATVSPMDAAVTAPRELDEESREWLRALRATGTGHDQAVERLHALLLRATRFEVARRRPTLPHVRGNDLDEIALQAADDTLMSVLARLDD